MKKMILVLILLLVTLTACETTTTNPPVCVEGYHIEDNKCVKDEDKDTPVDPVIPGDYDNELCTHLDPIGDWEAVWCDEFNYVGLPDSDKWNYDVGGSGWGNNELQYYTIDDEDNAYVDGEYLTITAIKENYGSNAYTSARLITKNTGDWLYGKIQVRAKMPSGKGTWPAIWMLPTDWAYGGWPHSGEIDIMEHVGYDPNQVYTTIHTGAYNHSLHTQIGYNMYGTTWESEFHIYEIEWEPGVIRSYIDGELYGTFDYIPEDNIEVENFMAWPFDQRFHLLLNIAVGGSWGGAQGVDTSIWPQEMVVDYVRVYQKDYEGLDQSAPEQVQNMRILKTSTSSVFVGWDKAVDDVMVKEYQIYLDGVLHDTTTLNGIKIENLTAGNSYTLGIKAVDFALNESPINTLSIQTNEPKSVLTKTEAEEYEKMRGIQTEDTTDQGGGKNVGWTSPGDYLSYTLVVPESGNYVVDFRVASDTDGGDFTLSESGNFLANVTTPATGGWQSWTTVTSNAFYMEAGTYTFTITFNTDGQNLNYFIFKKVE